MKKLILLFIAVTTFTTVSYASFPVSETTNNQSIEKSEISTVNNIEYVGSETNEANNSALPYELSLVMKIVLGIFILMMVYYLLFVPAY